MTTIFRALVVDLPPTPLGLLPGRWTIEHWCTICRSQVATPHLVAHAQAHTHTKPTSDSPQDQPHDSA